MSMRDDTTCDLGCPATALVRVARDRLTLMFCGHHYAVNQLLLELGGWSVHADRRDPGQRQAYGHVAG
ncbi:hypothetical protein AB0J80_02230 [Actinoplanes sp. NPDC049548]|uniref:DUF7455 domain-containing protein n=1 Tax=Actinoplanes sp. NPDC049548 TaxID=3155152 RepID=UPI00341EA761